MAKVKAPLLSFSASGQIAETLVYFTWKGLNAVRQYVIPSNPNTALQQTQRGYMTAAVAKVHAAIVRATHPLDQADISAYALLASLRATPRTWFNEAVKLWLDCKVLADIPVIYSDGETTSDAAAAATMQIWLNEETASQLAAGTFFLGSSKTSLIQSTPGTVVAGVSVSVLGGDAFDGLTVGTKYYWQFRADVADPCEGADSGIYSFVAT